MNLYLRTLKATVDLFPAVREYLSTRARWAVALAGEWDGEVKTEDFFRRTLTRLVRSLYDGLIGGEFIDIMANLIRGQLTQAYRAALSEEGVPMDAQFTARLEGLILAQFDFVDGFYRDIIDARVDGTPIEPLLARVELWVRRYKETYNEALREITRRFGGKMMWTLGKTETHCETCEALHGIVAFHADWERFGFRPQSAPNQMLDCGGWRCDCSLTPTKRRRSRNSAERLAAIAARRFEAIAEEGGETWQTTL